MELVKPGYVGPKHETAHSINNELRTIKDQMDLVFKYFEVNEIIPTPPEVNKKYKERMSGIAPRKPGSAQSDPNLIQIDPNRSKFDPNHLLNSAFVEKVFLLIKEDHRVSRKTIAERLNTSERKVRQAIDLLRNTKIRRVGTTRGEWEIIEE